MKATLAALVLGVVAFGAVATSHPQSWINITGDQLLDCNPDAIPEEAGGGDLGVWPADGQGGACFAAGDVLPDADGLATVFVFSDQVADASAYYGQDVDGDGSSDPASFIFCNTADLEVFVGDPGDPARTGNWDPLFASLVWIDGPVFGNAALSACGTLYSGSVSGTIDHT